MLINFLQSKLLCKVQLIASRLNETGFTESNLKTRLDKVARISRGNLNYNGLWNQVCYFEGLKVQV